MRNYELNVVQVSDMGIEINQSLFDFSIFNFEHIYNHVSCNHVNWPV